MGKKVSAEERVSENSRNLSVFSSFEQNIPEIAIAARARRAAADNDSTCHYPCRRSTSNTANVRHFRQTLPCSSFRLRSVSDRVRGNALPMRSCRALQHRPGSELEFVRPRTNACDSR